MQTDRQTGGRAGGHVRARPVVQSVKGRQEGEIPWNRPKTQHLRRLKLCFEPATLPPTLISARHVRARVHLHINPSICIHTMMIPPRKRRHCHCLRLKKSEKRCESWRLCSDIDYGRSRTTSVAYLTLYLGKLCASSCTENFRSLLTSDFFFLFVP